MTLKHLLASCVTGAAIALTSMPLGAQTYPSDTVTLIVPSRPGGSIDRMARSVQRYLGDALGVGVEVQNIPGAGSKIGVAAFAEAEPDGHTILAHFSPGIVQVHVEDPELAYLDDMAIINAPWSDPGILVAQQGRWESFDAFVAEARDNPGSITFGSSGSVAIGTILALDLFDQLGLDIRIVPFDGGGETRSAFLGGLVDMTAAGVQGALRIRDSADPMVLFWDEPVEAWSDAPLVGDVLANYDATALSGSATRFFATHAAFAKANPEGFATLVAAFEAVSQDADYQANAAETRVGSDWLGPDMSASFVHSQAKAFLPLLSQD